MISDQLGNLIAYLPKLISGLLIFAVGIYIPNIARIAILSMFSSLELTGGSFVGNIVFYVIAMFLNITALNQEDVETDLITNNLSIIFASILLAFEVDFGFGSTGVFKRLLFSYYSRKNLQVGDKIRSDNFEGVIESINNISVVLSSENKTVIIPIKEIVDNKIKILS